MWLETSLLVKILRASRNNYGKLLVTYSGKLLKIKTKVSVRLVTRKRVGDTPEIL